MKRKSFGDMPCPVARSLEHVGEWWSILIMRDALGGMTRFDDFAQSLGIAPNMLSRRLTALVEAGLLEKHRYSERPVRHDYVLTQRGRDFQSVLIALFAWGSRHFPAPGMPPRLMNVETGREAEPQMIDRASGRPMSDPVFRVVRTPS